MPLAESSPTLRRQRRDRRRNAVANSLIGDVSGYSSCLIISAAWCHLPRWRSSRLVHQVNSRQYLFLPAFAPYWGLRVCHCWCCTPDTQITELIGQPLNRSWPMSWNLPATVPHLPEDELVVQRPQLSRSLAWSSMSVQDCWRVCRAPGSIRPFPDTVTNLLRHTQPRCLPAEFRTVAELQLNALADA
jgi:hypothetical protein